MSQRIPGLFIAHSDLEGRGVFTSEPITKGSIIEICNIIELSPTDLELIKKTVLYDYYFDWKKQEGHAAIALGYGSLYNHAYQPNTEYVHNYGSNTLEIYALRDIEAGEELTFNYNGIPDDQTKVWFEK